MFRPTAFPEILVCPDGSLPPVPVPSSTASEEVARQPKQAGPPRPSLSPTSAAPPPECRATRFHALPPALAAAPPLPAYLLENQANRPIPRERKRFGDGRRRAMSPAGDPLRKRRVHDPPDRRPRPSHRLPGDLRATGRRRWLSGSAGASDRPESDPGSPGTRRRAVDRTWGLKLRRASPAGSHKAGLRRFCYPRFRRLNTP